MRQGAHQTLESLKHPEHPETRQVGSDRGRGGKILGVSYFRGWSHPHVREKPTYTRRCEGEKARLHQNPNRTAAPLLTTAQGHTAGYPEVTLLTPPLQSQGLCKWSYPQGL